MTVARLGTLRHRALLSWHAISLVVALGLSSASHADEWPAMQGADLAVQPGSVLDFSAFHALKPIKEADALVIDPAGDFRVRGSGLRPRFLIAALGMSNLNGGFPAEDDTQAWVDQVVRRGYNMVRLDFIEDVLMNRRMQDLDPDPVQLRRLHHLLYRLREAGVYYILNLVSSNNGAYGNITERWRGQKDLLTRMYTEPAAVAHWKDWVRRVYGSPNPYTGQSILQDPALAGVALLNESGLNMLTRQGTPPVLEAQWKSWMDQQKSLPSPPVWKIGMRNDAAWQTWMVEREDRMARDLTQFVRDLGFKGAVTAYNNWLSPAASVSRSRLQWVDMHDYAAEPDQWVTPGSRLKSVSVIEQKGGYLLDLAATRVWGKPFTATEYGQVFWDPLRREHLLMGPAVAALQGWQAIGQHSRAIELMHGGKGSLQEIRPFQVGMDPISRAGDVIAAAVFARGDLQSSKHRVELVLDDRYALHEAGPLSSVSRAWSQIALLAGVGLRSSQVPAAAGAQAITLKARPDAGSPAWQELLQRWRKASWWPADNRTQAEKGQFHSDTGELWLDAEAGVFSLQAEKFEGVTLQRGGSFSLQALKVLGATQGVTVALFSPQPDALKVARRLLLVVCTDVRNTGMQFRDSRSEVLAQLGTLPARVEPVQIHLQMSLRHAKWALYPVAMNGRRHQAVPIKGKDGQIEFLLDTSKLPQGPALFFELVAGS